ncbi:MAG TPA: flavin reductase family protein [Roseiflexaceae bacterium]|nr:flavin reductase family protein [Roseiflexaceae bacterium]
MDYQQFDPQMLGEREIYKLLIGCVVPRPIAWVSTVDRLGVRNLAPFSFFNAIGSNPPAVSVSINYTGSADQRKDTLRNIVDTSEFVVNLVDEELASAMNLTAANYPPTIDEFEVAGVAATPSVAVRPPRVAQTPVSLECRLLTAVPVGQGPGSATLVIGVIQMIHVRTDIISERRYIDITKLRPVARLAGSSYAYVHETFDMIRPAYNESTGEIELPG